jgi:hypothetical protein
MFIKTIFFTVVLACSLAFFAQPIFAYHVYKVVKSKHPSSPSTTIAATVYPGTLRANVEKLAYQHGKWHVVWKVTNNYKCDGFKRIYARNFKEAIAKLLANYPLQAEFYPKKRILLIRLKNHSK